MSLKVRKSKPTEAASRHAKDVRLLMRFNDTGKFDRAEAKARSLLQVFPTAHAIHSALGFAQAEQGKYDEAVESYRRAVTIKPDFAEAWNNLGDALRKSDKPVEGSEALVKALAVNPVFAEAMFNLGQCHLDINSLPDAEACFRRAIELDPNYEFAYASLARVLEKQLRYKAANLVYDKLISIEAFGDRYLQSYGEFLKNINDNERAIEVYDRSIDRGEHLVDSLTGKGSAEQILGRFEDAKASFYKAIGITPQAAGAYRQLESIVKGEEREKLIADMLKLDADAELPPKVRMNLGFALGKAFETDGRHEESFEYLRSANALRHEDAGFDFDKEKRNFEAIKAAFLEARENPPAPHDATTPVPIFIVSMPRSGSTLCEQILASHSKVYGAGELEDFVRALNDGFLQRLRNVEGEVDWQFDLEKLHDLAPNYIKRVTDDIGKVEYFTDKLPANFRWIGFIKMIMPHAKIIHCKRNPIDSCFSMYKLLFGADALNYVYDMNDLGQYYGLYNDMMNFWKEYFPDDILDVVYEDIVSDEETMKRIVEFCDLEWEEACREFYELKRPVKTASLVQVRQKMYGTSVEAWRKYERQLQPLIESLEANGVETNAGKTSADAGS